MVASWFVKLIWDLIFILARANHLTNRHQKYCFALIILIQRNVIRKFHDLSVQKVLLDRTILNF